jgi:hypothetical protein
MTDNDTDAKARATGHALIQAVAFTACGAGEVQAEGLGSRSTSKGPAEVSPAGSSSQDWRVPRTLDPPAEESEPPAGLG